MDDERAEFRDLFAKIPGTMALTAYAVASSLSALSTAV
jgi:hypothetical protein